MSLPDRDLIARFLEMLAAEQGVAKNTLSAYQSDLMSASGLLHSKLAVAEPDALVELARQWRHLANSSVARKASALRRFFAFLHEEGFRADNPSAALPKPAQMRPLPKILDTDEVDTLFAVIEAKLAQAHPISSDYRLLALIELLYGSGLRATELVALPRNAVTSDRPFIIIKGKGDKERLIPISNRARHAVSAWTSFLKNRGFCFRRAGGISAVFACSRSSRTLPRIRGSTRRRSVRMSCGMPLPRIFWRAALICGRCSPCWGMRTSRRRRFTRMSIAASSSNWSIGVIHWQRAH